MENVSTTGQLHYLKTNTELMSTRKTFLGDRQKEEAKERASEHGEL